MLGLVAAVQPVGGRQAAPSVAQHQAPRSRGFGEVRSLTIYTITLPMRRTYASGMLCAAVMRHASTTAAARGRRRRWRSMRCRRSPPQQNRPLHAESGRTTLRLSYAALLRGHRELLVLAISEFLQASGLLYRPDSRRDYPIGVPDVPGARGNPSCGCGIFGVRHDDHASRATRWPLEFELVLHGDDETRLRTAGEAALDEIERLDEQLSFFRPTSRGSRRQSLGRRAANQARAPADVGLLQRCKEIWTATGGAFDPTIGPVMRLLRPPTAEPQSAWLSDAARPGGGPWRRGLRGRRSSDAGTVRFTKPGMALDLGAVGRGYAIDRGIEILGAHGVTSALLRGGTSSVHVIGTPPGECGMESRDGRRRPEATPATGGWRWSIRRSRCRDRRARSTGAPLVARRPCPRPADRRPRGAHAGGRRHRAQLADVRHALDGTAGRRRVVAGHVDPRGFLGTRGWVAEPAPHVRST